MAVTEQFHFGPDFKRKVLALAVRGDLLLSVGVDGFRSEFFGDSQLKSPQFQLAEIILRFASKHASERPGNATMDELVREAAQMLRPESRKALEDEWKDVRGCDIPDPDYVQQRVVDWARTTALMNALVSGGQLLQGALDGRGDSVDFKAIEKAVADAVAIGTRTEQRTALWNTPDVTYWLDDDTRTRIPTSLGSLDSALRGGPRLGEVFFIIAPPKGTKTSFLTNVAMGAANARKNVAWFSYEMRKDVMRKRLDRRFMRMSREEVVENLGKLQHARIGMLAAGAGQIWIEEAIAGQMSCAEIGRRIEWLRGSVMEVDLVVIDYLNIMVGGNIGELRHTLARHSREMTVLAKQSDVVVWSAALVNRKAVDKNKIVKADVAEAFEILAVVDGVVAVCGDEALRQQGLRNLYTTALRDAEDEQFAGQYFVDLDRMTFREVDAPFGFGGDGELPKEDAE